MSEYLRTDDRTKRIVKVIFSHEADPYPDLSFLGEYSSKPGTETRTIDREERGDRLDHEYRYFVAALSGEETGNLKSVEQDYQRMEAYHRQVWWMMFCQAKAKVSIHGVLQTLTSGGLGNVESDAGKDYFQEIRDEQFNELRAILADVGFSNQQIGEAFKAA